MTPGGAAVLLPNESSLQSMLAEATTLSPRAAEREALTVEVQNGTNNENMEALAASHLNYAGYVSHISAADRRDYTYSVLYDLTTAQDTNEQNLILSALGLADSGSIVSQPDPDSKVAYRLVLGYDYDPCFRPEELSH
jgi:hypothetical protein